MNINRVSASCSPCWSSLALTLKNGTAPNGTDTKKDVGVKFLSAPIPGIRLSHCPFIRISNVKPAHAEWYTNPLRPDNPKRIYTKIHSTYGELHLIYIYKERGRGEYEIHPRERFVASPLLCRFKVAKFDQHRQVTCWKRPFETGRTTGLRSLPSMSILPPAHTRTDFIGANLHIFF